MEEPGHSCIQNNAFQEQIALSPLRTDYRQHELSKSRDELYEIFF